MNDDAESCVVTGEDLKAALAEMKGYVDITVEDLMKIYTLALEKERARLARSDDNQRCLGHAGCQRARGSDASRREQNQRSSRS